MDVLIGYHQNKDPLLFYKGSIPLKPTYFEKLGVRSMTYIEEDTKEGNYLSWKTVPAQSKDVIVALNYPLTSYLEKDSPKADDILQDLLVEGHRICKPSGFLLLPLGPRRRYTAEVIEKIHEFAQDHSVDWRIQSKEDIFPFGPKRNDDEKEVFLICQKRMVKRKHPRVHRTQKQKAKKLKLTVRKSK